MSRVKNIHYINPRHLHGTGLLDDVVRAPLEVLHGLNEFGKLQSNRGTQYAQSHGAKPNAGFAHKSDFWGALGSNIANAPGDLLQAGKSVGLFAKGKKKYRR